MSERYATSADAALLGDVDLERTIRAVPDSFTVRGMFFTRYVAALGAEWEELLPTLEAPAKHGRYHAFENYPTRDYLRLFGRVAAARFPGSTREAFRLLARGEVEVFAESTLGRVTFALLRDPAGALLRYPDVFRAVIHGPQLTARRLGDRRVVITDDNHHGSVEVTLGVIEGVVQTFDETPRAEVTVESERRVVLDVTW
ncbi:MAG: hypothetical protein JWP97_1600 [Labilithrix sp.]|nr:hypothetical protein [Labilithrix sp.]